MLEQKTAKFVSSESREMTKHLSLEALHNGSDNASVQRGACTDPWPEGLTSTKQTNRNITQRQQPKVCDFPLANEKGLF